jgi:hypothetical protein
LVITQAFWGAISASVAKPEITSRHRGSFTRCARRIVGRSMTNQNAAAAATHAANEMTSEAHYGIPAFSSRKKDAPATGLWIR